MKKNQEIELKIEGIEFPNMGIGQFEGKKVYVKNALQGQTVGVRLSKTRSTYAEGKITQVITPAPYEINSFCEHFGLCGGCSLQTMPYEEQLAHKSGMIGDLIGSVSGETCEFGGIIPSPELYEYRNKMEFTFGDLTKGGEMQLGMHKKGHFSSVVTVDHCHLCDSDFRLILSSVLEYGKKHNIPHYNKFSHMGILRHLMIRKGKQTGEILVALSAKDAHLMNLSEFKDMLLALPLQGQIVGVLHVNNTEKSDAFQGDIEILHGRDYYYDMILGLKFKVSLYSFFQTNTLGAEVLYSKAVDFLGEIDGKYIFDLFSGTGTIAQVLSSRASKVVGIEIVADAVEMAKVNAELNGLTNCEFIAGDVFAKLDEVKDHKPDLIVVDPPRNGIMPKSLDKIIEFGVKEMVYVSCNPKTLVENLEQLKEAGYVAVKAIAMDMFPHTPHVECVVKLEKR